MSPQTLWLARIKRARAHARADYLNLLVERDGSIEKARDLAGLGHCEMQVRALIHRAREANRKLLECKRVIRSKK